MFLIDKKGNEWKWKAKHTKVKFGLFSNTGRFLRGYKEDHWLNRSSQDPDGEHYNSACVPKTPRIHLLEDCEIWEKARQGLGNEC